MFENNNSVYLRAFEIDDYKLINKWHNDPEITKNVVGNRIFISSEKEKQKVEEAITNDKVNMYLSICDKATNEMVGYTSVREINWRNKSARWGEIIIGKENQKKGYAYAAGALILHFVFSELGINRFFTDYFEGDTISEKIFQKMGFITEGIGRQEFFKAGKYQNVARASMLKREYDGNL